MKGMVKSILLSLVILTGFLASPFSSVAAAEKLKLGTSIKLSPVFYLPIMAADEKGLWKENGLDVEWLPFAGSAAMFQAVVARSLVVGQTDSPSLILAASRAVPVVAVSDLQSVELFVAWVRTAINYKEPKDLKGNKCGTPRLGGVAHAYCLALAKKFGLEKDIKTISVGGIPQIFAALKTGAIDLAVEPTHLMIRLKESGDIKVLATISELVPKGLPGHWVFADRGFASSNPATVKNLVKATLQATSFLRANGDWAAAKMVSVSNFTPVAAREIFKDYRFARDGRISKAAIENLESFLVEYNVMAKEKTPAVDAVYTERFLP